MNNLFSLSNKIALITGGSRGIGFSLVKGFCEAGAKVFFTARNKEGIDQALKQLEGYDVYGIVSDVTNEDDIKQLITQINKYGPIDILVNNAGINIKQPLHELENKNYEAVLKVNLDGPVKITREVLPQMMERKKGKIINICSMMSEIGTELNTSYSISKGAIKMLTRNIAAEYGKYNIQCNGIGPGYIYTELNKPMRIPNEDGSINNFEKYINARIPLGHWGQTDDLVGPAIFLASDASNYVNGQILYVDGGLLASLGDSSQI